MDKVIELANSLKLWQFSLLVSITLLLLGFTGGVPFTELELRDGEGQAAIIAGVVFFIATCVLKYIPPPEVRHRVSRPSVAISPTQIGLISRFADWIDFDAAAKEKTPDSKLPKAQLEIKNTQLRIELATLQGIAMRRVTAEGVHQVKYRNGESTTWVPSE